MPICQRVRTKYGLTLLQMAELMGLPRDTVKKWEAGKRHPNGPSRTLLILLDRSPTILEDMAEINGVDLTPVKKGRPRKST